MGERSTCPCGGDLRYMLWSGLLYDVRCETCGHKPIWYLNRAAPSTDVPQEEKDGK